MDTKLICFLPVSVEKELPKEDKTIVFIKGEQFFGVNPKYFHPGTLKKAYTHFLREFSLPELIEEANEWIEDNYDKIDKNKYLLKNEKWVIHRPKSTYYTYKEVLNEFLTQKGIIEESGPDWDALKDFPNKAF